MKDTNAPGLRLPCSTSMPPYHSTSTVMTMGKKVYRNV